MFERRNLVIRIRPPNRSQGLKFEAPIVTAQPNAGGAQGRKQRQAASPSGHTRAQVPFVPHCASLVQVDR